MRIRLATNIIKMERQLQGRYHCGVEICRDAVKACFESRSNPKKDFRFAHLLPLGWAQSGMVRVLAVFQNHCRHGNTLRDFTGDQLQGTNAGYNIHLCKNCDIEKESCQCECKTI